MEAKHLKEFTDDMATTAIQKLGIDFSREKFDEEQFRKGIKEEYEEHLKTIDGEVTVAAKIALDHLRAEGAEHYYDHLEKMEEEMKSPGSIKTFQQFIK